MSERMTWVHPRDNGVSGLMAYGRETRAAMIQKYREHYRIQLLEAQTALSKLDEELIVETFLGPYACKNVEEVE